MTVIYQTIDGRQFDSELEALKHENYLLSQQEKSAQWSEKQFKKLANRKPRPLSEVFVD